jgi:hypothetical protein
VSAKAGALLVLLASQPSAAAKVKVRASDRLRSSRKK